MASKILLISTNRCSAPDPVFPLGLAHLNAALRTAGHEVRWFDSLADSDRLEETLADFKPDYIGISLRNIDDVLIRKKDTFFHDLISLSGTLRQHTSCPRILGGSGFSIFPEELLQLTGAEFGIRGEGEAASVALIAALEQGQPFQSIPGLVFRENGVIRMNPPASAPPDQAVSDADRPVSVTTHYVHASGTLNLQSQRGCAFRCCYCTYPLIEGRLHRRRPPDVVAEELEQLQQAGAKYVFIVDSVFNSSARHVTEICEAILRRGLKMSWGCFLRPQGLTSDLMQLMARAGLAHIEFGSDSFCDTVLSAYDKDFTFEEILESSERAREANVDFCHFLISGGPGETRETLEEGFANSLRLRNAVIMAVVGMRLYPGTPLFERALEEGRIERGLDLLTPRYYVSSALTPEAIFEQLQEFARRSPNWVVGDPSPAYASLVDRLRKRGVVGPLWSYFSIIQRLWPQGTTGAPR